MQKDNEWNQKSLYHIEKKAHEKNILGVTKHDENLFLTSSEDATVRLWDMRVKSSIKLIKSKELTSQLTNPASNNKDLVFIGSDKSVYSFDLRKEQIFIEQTKNCSEDNHYDSVNQIKYSNVFDQLLCCDDEGDIRVYQPETLKCLNKLEQEHINICNDIGYIYSPHKDFLNKKVCVSGGFDSTLIIWDIQEQKPIKRIKIEDILKKYQIKSEQENYAFIHKIFCHQSSIITALETGHIICMPIYEPRKPKFIMQASLTRLTACAVVTFQSSKNKNHLITTDAIDSFSIYDFEQRVNGQPKFLIKYKTTAEAHAIEAIGNNLLLATASPSLSVYTLKG